MPNIPTRETPVHDNFRPWFREPMVWLTILLPACAFAAGLITLILAYAGADPEVARTEQSGRIIGR